MNDKKIIIYCYEQNYECHCDLLQGIMYYKRSQFSIMNDTVNDKNIVNDKQFSS